MVSLCADINAEQITSTCIHTVIRWRLGGKNVMDLPIACYQSHPVGFIYEENTSAPHLFPLPPTVLHPPILLRSSPWTLSFGPSLSYPSYVGEYHIHTESKLSPYLYHQGKGSDHRLP